MRPSTNGEMEQAMTLIAVAWISFGLGTTLGFLLARSVETVDDSADHAEQDVVSRSS